MYRPRSILLLVAVLWAAASGLCADTLRVATFNLLNYNLSGRMVDGYYRGEYPKPEDEKEAVRAVIAEVNPDILAVQEIGRAGFLLELQRDLLADGLDYPHTALVTGRDSDRALAVLSRMPFAGTVEHDGLDFPFFNKRYTVARGLQEVRFETGGVTWSLFNLHLKSRRTSRDDDPRSAIQREKEARVIRDRIKRTVYDDARGRYLVVGDFNDTKDSKPLARFLQSGDKELGIMLPARDPAGDAWTHYYAKADSYDRVDYILPSPAMAAYLLAPVNRIHDTPAMRKASDHRLVYVDLEF